MSNKPRTELNPVDQELRRLHPIEMGSGVQVTIEKVLGFELFNTRPYHNYETWSDGYRVTGADGISAEAEDLDDAVALYAARRAEAAALEGTRSSEGGA